jgi:hypothetical protein
LLLDDIRPLAAANSGPAFENRRHLL